MWLDDLATYVAGLGITNVTAVGTDLFKNWLPETPDKATILTATGGTPPIQRMGGSVAPIETPGFQLRVRGPKGGSVEAQDRIWAIFRALGKVTEVTQGSTRFLAIEPNQQPTWMGVDQSERPEYVCNFGVTIQ